jgi:hypothetical protein
MKPLLAFAIAVMLPIGTNAQSTNACIELNVNVDRYDAMNQFVGRTTPEQTVFDYGDHFELLIDGTFPGTYFLENISPSGVSSWVGLPAYSDGIGPLHFPCGLDGLCTTGTEKFRFVDDNPELPTNSISEEMLIIYYLPCRTGDPARDRNIGTLADSLPDCIGRPESFPADHRFYSERTESIQLVDPVNQVCTLPPVGEPVLLFERVTLIARR